MTTQTSEKLEPCPSAEQIAAGAKALHHCWTSGLDDYDKVLAKQPGKVKWLSEFAEACWKAMEATRPSPTIRPGRMKGAKHMP